MRQVYAPNNAFKQELLYKTLIYAENFFKNIPKKISMCYIKPSKRTPSRKNCRKLIISQKCMKSLNCANYRKRIKIQPSGMYLCIPTQGFSYSNPNGSSFNSP